MLGNATDHKSVDDSRGADAGVSRGAVRIGLFSFAKFAVWAQAWLAADGVDPDRGWDSGDVCRAGRIAGRIDLHDDANLDATARLPGDREPGAAAFGVALLLGEPSGEEVAHLDALGALCGGDCIAAVGAAGSTRSKEVARANQWYSRSSRTGSIDKIRTDFGA